MHYSDNNCNTDRNAKEKRKQNIQKRNLKRIAFRSFEHHFSNAFYSMRFYSFQQKTKFLYFTFSICLFLSYGLRGALASAHAIRWWLMVTYSDGDLRASTKAMSFGCLKKIDEALEVTALVVVAVVVVVVYDGIVCRLACLRVYFSAPFACCFEDHLTTSCGVNAKHTVAIFKIMWLLFWCGMVRDGARAFIRWYEFFVIYPN